MNYVQIEARRKAMDTILIMWQLLPLTNAVRDFDIYFAWNDADKFKKLSTTQATAYLHKTPDLINNETVRYYIKHKDIKSEIVYPDNIYDPYLYGIANQYYWQLINCSQGVECKVYCILRISEHCPECWSSTLKKRIKTHCNTCDGSGTINGYKGPVTTYIAMRDEQVQEDLTAGMKRKLVIRAAWTGNIPILSYGDIIVTNNSDVYIVSDYPSKKTIGNLFNQRIVVKQQMLLEKLDIENELYQKFSN